MLDNAIININKSKQLLISSTSKGNQAKYKQNGMWYKLDTLGYEGLAEELSSILLSFIDDINYVSYHTCQVNIGDNTNLKRGCSSENFLGENEELITFHRFLEAFGYNLQELDKLSIINRITTILTKIENSTGLKLLDYVSRIIYLDAIIANEDRHLNNLSFIYNTKTGIYKEAPIFDNGLSLLSDLKDYPFTVARDINLRNVNYRPFSTDVKKQIHGIQQLNPNFKLKIRVDKLKEKLNKYINEIYLLEEVERGKAILESNLKIYEGSIWND